MLAAATVSALARRGIPLGDEGPAAADAGPATPLSSSPPVDAGTPAAPALAAAGPGEGTRPAPPVPPEAPPVPPWLPAPTADSAVAAVPSPPLRRRLPTVALPSAPAAAAAPPRASGPVPPRGARAPAGVAYAGTHFRGGRGLGFRGRPPGLTRPPGPACRRPCWRPWPWWPWVRAPRSPWAVGGGGSDDGDRAGPATTRQPASTSSTTETAREDHHHDRLRRGLHHDGDAHDGRHRHTHAGDDHDHRRHGRAPQGRRLRGGLRVARPPVRRHRPADHAAMAGVRRRLREPQRRGRPGRAAPHLRPGHRLPGVGPTRDLHAHGVGFRRDRDGRRQRLRRQAAAATATMARQMRAMSSSLLT